MSNLSCRLAAVLTLLVATVARAQDPPRRQGIDRQAVVQLAYALGEAHALRRLCAGPADSTWYSRMQRLEQAETGDESGRHQLVDAFNAGFASRQEQFPACSRRSRAAEQAVADRGRTLARRLAEAPSEREDEPSGRP